MIKRDLTRHVTHAANRQSCAQSAPTQSVDGFAFDDQDPARILRVEVLKDGLCIAAGYANKYRHDLLLEGVGDGRHCFEIELPENIGIDDEVHIRIVNDSTGERIDHSAVPILHVNAPSVVEEMSQAFFKLCKKLEPEELIQVAHSGHWKDLLNHKSEYESAFCLLADEESQQTFRWFIPFRLLSYSLISVEDAWSPRSWRRLHEVAAGGAVTPEQWLRRIEDLKVSRHMQDHLLFSFGHYALPGICEVLPGDCVIDAGAFDGISSVVFADKCGAEGRVFAFEPIEAHCKQIERLKRRLRNDRLHIVPKALSNDKSTARMRESFQGSCIDSTGAGGLAISTTSLDDFVQESRIGAIDFLKVDVEGHELKLLEGAKGTIREMKPKMAVSIYHRNEDIFVLPEYIRNLCPEYRFYLRHHCYNSCELVLYCVT